MKALVIIIFVSLLFCLYWFICGFISTWHKLVIKQAKLDMIDYVLEHRCVDNPCVLVSQIEAIKSEIEKE